MNRILILFLGAVLTLGAQCPIDARVTKTAMRNGNNNMYGAVIGWAASGYWWEWQVEVTGSLNFTPTGGSPSSIASGQKFGWLAGLGSASGIGWTTGQALEPRGNGSYYTQGSGIFVAPYCGAGGSIPAANSPTQIIKRPERPDYQAVPYHDAIMYLGRDASNNLISQTQQYKNFATIVPGAPNGASGVPDWSLLQSGSKGQYATISATTGTTTKLTASNYSDDCLVYNVTLKASYDGFYSEPMYIFINRPHKMIYRYWEDEHDPIGSGYLSSLYYEVETRCNWVVMSGYGVNGTPDGTAVNFSNWPPIENISNVASERLPVALLSPGPSSCGPNNDETCNPLPSNPQTPLGNVETQQRWEMWRVGSIMPGTGLPVQRNLSRKYQDHAAHSNFTTPIVLD